MIDGIDSSRIIVGAYTDRDGGVCPMLAAHRFGGRTNLASFARAWDRYTGAKGGRPRPASDRERRTLHTMLEASIALEELGDTSELGRAIDEHRARRGRFAPELPGTGDRDRAPELRHRHGWAWLRIFRRYDAYQKALDDLEQAERSQEERERELV
ncbi:MAG: hypothetical protein ABR581_10640 [Thermoleophilaceae bacterium]